jgi:tRNA (guanine-N7-)-methyltransferase
MRARYHPLAIPTITASPYVYPTKEAFLSGGHPRLHVEIGCGKGQFLIAQAQAHPNIQFIGVELVAPVLYRALEKLEGQTLPNLKFIWGDADEWLEGFEGPVERLYLQFSDPWPKARHEKRRLTNAARLFHYASFVTGSVFFKTDNEAFYLYSLTQFQASPFHIESHGILSSKDSDTPTEFEMKYRKLGQDIYYIEAKR